MDFDPEQRNTAFQDGLKKLLGWIVSIVVVSGIIWIWGAATTSNTQPAPTPPVQAAAPTFVVDPHIQAIGNQLGINPDYLVAAHATYGVGPTTLCTAEALSCYTQNTDGTNPTLYLYPNTGTESPLVNLDHEFLHWVWYQKLTAQQRTDECAGLMQEYQSNYYLYQRMQPYRDGGITGDTLCSELHSVIGTEQRIDELTPSWQTYYRSWVPGLDSLPSYF